MKLRPEQISHHLTKSCLPTYLVSSNELLLLQDVVAEIKEAAKKQGFLEHRVFQITASFNWENFLIDAFTLSLFSTKGVIELRFGTQMPNAAAVKALQRYFERLPSHKILIIVIEKLEGQMQKTAWFKLFDQKGGIIQIWPIDKNQLPTWLVTRARKQGLNLSSSASTLLAEYVEGNLLAATQVLNQLALSFGDIQISQEHILKITGDQAKFNVFDLTETLLLQDLKRSYRIFKILEEEEVEPLFILTILTKEIRLVASCAYQMEQGVSLEKVLQAVFPMKKQALFRRIVPKFPTQKCRLLMKKAREVDRVVKGAERGYIWRVLSEFCLAFCRG